MIIEYQTTIGEIREALVIASQRNVKRAQKRIGRVFRWYLVGAVALGVLMAALGIRFASQHIPFFAAQVNIAAGFFVLLMLVRQIAAYLFGRKFWPPPIILLYLSIPMLPVVFNLLTDQNRPPITELVGPHLIWFSLGLLQLAGAAFTRCYVTGRMWDESANIPTKADIGVDGITVSTPNAVQTLGWLAFSGNDETKRLFLLYSNKMTITVPKRAFVTLEQLNAMRAMMRLADGKHIGGFPVNLPPADGR